ncbi:kinase-like domain-containing protein [Biscogniauxia mediterranea]|nr:kinase-like domain-containing protein [Biscogniauxia mediterranea]
MEVKQFKQLFKSIFRSKPKQAPKTKATNNEDGQIGKDAVPPSPMMAEAEDVARSSSRDIDTPQPARTPPNTYTDVPPSYDFSKILEVPIVSTADATDFRAPDDLKVTLDLGNTSIHRHPVLRWGEYTYWPLSYIDNRVSFAIVVTNSKGEIVKRIPANGARYLREIEVNIKSQEVSFIGQVGQVATLRWNDLFIDPATSQQELVKVYPNSNGPPSTGISMTTVEESLESYFTPSRKRYTNEDLYKIGKLLQRTDSSKYSKSPRLYTLLRHLGCLEDLDRLLEKGLSDRSLPLSRTQLPSNFREGWKKRFRSAQDIVCNDSEIIQMISSGNHMSFSKTPDFERKRVFGKGGRGEVDEVVCSAGPFTPYARKRIARPDMSTLDTAVMRAFQNEVDSMKQIVHRHCVELVTSYTDPTSFAILMLPVADCNLAKYLQDAPSSPNQQSFLREFFGCLARGLMHIHGQHLRHRDIKPENVLVHRNKVLFTDFDCSLNWSHTMHSTTTEVPPRTKEYASPEVAHSGFIQNTRINSSSDIWSLGCIFLEIVTVMKGRSIEDLVDLRAACYCYSLEGISQWIEELRKVDPQQSVEGDEPLDWIEVMLRDDPNQRPTAHRVVELTTDFCCFECRVEN